MARPRLFRDPIHLQLRYERAEGTTLPEPGRKRLGWVVQRIIDSPEFQRLRHIRQTGLANVVFHGAEHSRFSHSMGVAYLAAEMFGHISRNMDETPDEAHLLATAVAALLHDVGHGPFSHSLEDILRESGVDFDHEKMTVRIIEESSIRKSLDLVETNFATDVAAYIDKKKRTADHWRHKLVSSQLDADRLDYLLRDAAAAGLRGHTYDLSRLLDMIQHLDGKRIAVHRRGLETVEGYLVALDQMYRAVYYHHTIRAASVLLGSVFQRAIELVRQGDKKVVPDGHPLRSLFEAGHKCDLSQYLRLGEYQVWSLIEGWQTSEDKCLADLSVRLMQRRLFKTMELDVSKISQFPKIMKIAEELACKAIPSCDEKTKHLYVRIDEPTRISYRTYDWRTENPDESIWICGGTKNMPIEAHPGSKIIDGLRDTNYFPRLVFASEIRDELLKATK
ncbi:MAG TPA: HD domain-containing protein [Kofleriaceae bacterium]|nr:HD domain-containing protein [Kofleriaceae bacterium]